jgi:hypothetical protein
MNIQTSEDPVQSSNFHPIVESEGKQLQALCALDLTLKQGFQMSELSEILENIESCASIIREGM